MHRYNVIEKMLSLYKDETIVQKKIKVAFKDELELDYGGLTKELFSEFWKKLRPNSSKERTGQFLSYP